jgi:hypothetical protein
MDAEDDNFATGIDACRKKDGGNAATGNLPMGGFVHTGVGDGSAKTHYPAIGQIQDGDVVYADAGGGDAITLNLSPAITAYVKGQAFTFTAAATITGAATLNVNSLGAKDIESGGAALVSGDIVQDLVYTVVYDGTLFQVSGGGSIGGATKIGVQNGDYVYQGAGGTADALTLAIDPPITAYDNGQSFTFRASADNTGAVTLNVNSLGAKAVEHNGLAIGAGYLLYQVLYTVVYDGVQFQLTNPSYPVGLTCAVLMSSDEAITHTTETQITFGSQEFDFGDFWDVGAPTRLTIPYTGLYTVTAQIGWFLANPSTDAKTRVRIVVNGDVTGMYGETQSYMMVPDGTMWSNNVVMPVSLLQKDDYIEISVYHEYSTLPVYVESTRTKVSINKV